MASEIVAGLATLNGIQNSGTAITLTGYATFILDRVSARHMFDIRDIKDSVGFDASAHALNEHVELTVDITLSGLTRAAAAASGVSDFLSPLQSVTLSNCKVLGEFGAGAGVRWCDGAYQYRGGATIDQGKDGEVKLSGMILRKYADSTQNTSMTTTVTG